MNKSELWDRYKRHLCTADSIGLRLDISRMMFDDAFLEGMSVRMEEALDAMERLEGGAIANPDEQRMVGHYWLRAPQLAPDPAIGDEIRHTVKAIKEFADQVHSLGLRPQRGDGFYVVLVIGIGGSALGPRFVADALGMSDDPMIVRFIDNTDPDGIDRTLAELDDALAQTLTIVISKSGGTVETRNAMLEVAAAYQRAELDFAKHAVAVTCDGSALHTKALEEKWIGTFPMWDWVGGRTSELSAVGLLPAALQGIDIDAMLAGARQCDIVTRSRQWQHANPAALLASMWHYAVTVRQRRNMVVLPYRDRLSLLGLYLQQLVMESIGKEVDRAGQTVHQGLSVFGNKGTTDQHSFIQQLREGTNDFFASFIDVRTDREGQSMPVEDNVTSGDYLSGFMLGTREALYENGRESINITLDKLDAHSVGVLIALFERAVGLYAELINVNAYNQPGVEAGKKAAVAIIDLQRAVLNHLRSNPDSTLTADEIAHAIDRPESAEDIFHILEHATANPDLHVTLHECDTLFTARYSSS
jgi:glucose-6-phosphate isomerase